MSAGDQRSKGNIQNLTAALTGSNLSEKKNAMKTIISAMTCGEDVSMFFTSVDPSIDSDHPEYGESEPRVEEVELLVRHELRQDTSRYRHTGHKLVQKGRWSVTQDALEDNNPILRALAIRTMGCIRVSQITEYLVDPLREALKDEDSYVRKTGVVCIAKLYESNPEMIERLGFIRMLENLLTDGNAMVVSNAIAVLGQISDQKGENLVHINDQLANKLINALSEANEWGKTYILDAFAKYEPSNPKIAEE